MTVDEDATKSDAESTDRSNPGRFGPSRRQLLATSAALGAGAFGGVPIASAGDSQEEDDDDDGEDADEPEGFEVEVLAEPAGFPEDVAAMFTLEADDETEDDDEDGEETATIGSHLDDASSLLVAEVTLEPGGTSGWHQHPGIGLVNVTEGEIEIQDAHDCATRTYTAGEAFLDPGQHVHTATNPSDDESAAAYVTFLGVPEDGPPTEWVEPRDC